jgi:hypothetical protein
MLYSEVRSKIKWTRTWRGIALIPILALALWILLPFLRNSRNLGYLDSAIVTVRILVDKEKQFTASHPQRGYTCNLSDLAIGEMAIEFGRAGERNGYSFEISCGDKNNNGLVESYRLTARPLHSHLPAICTDESGVLRSDEAGSPTKCLQNGTPF